MGSAGPRAPHLTRGREPRALRRSQWRGPGAGPAARLPPADNGAAAAAPARLSPRTAAEEKGPGPARPGPARREQVEEALRRKGAGKRR